MRICRHRNEGGGERLRGIFRGTGIVVFAGILAAVFLGASRAEALEASLAPEGVRVVFDAGTAILAADVEGRILRSTDGGAGFSVVKNGNPHDAVLAFERSGSVVVAVGRSGAIFRSTNGGASWTARHGAASAINGDWNGVANNGGQLWVAVGFSSSRIAWAVSTNGGVDWAASATGTNPFGALEGVVWHGAGSRFVAVGGDGVFNGLAFSSVNGSAWNPVSLPAGTAPLLFVSSDGNGGLLAGGESGFEGSLLLSGGAAPAFSMVGGSYFSETLRSGIAAGAGHWFVGGDDTVLVELTAAGARVAGVPVPGGEAIRSLVLSGPETLLVAGGLPDIAIPVVSPPKARIAAAGGELRIRATGTAAGRVYALETSVDLRNWQIVPGSVRTAGGETLEWTFAAPPGETGRFWRVRMD